MIGTSDFLDPMGATIARGPWASILARERIVVLGLAIGAALIHALNMFNYPSWAASGQEGATVYRAWALLEGRDLWGDLLRAAPAATLGLSAWLGAGSAVQGFGTAIDGGRVLMLLLHVAAVPLLFGLARLLGCNLFAAAFATTLFALSPGVVAHQRLVVADNFVSFWALLGLYLLLRTPLLDRPPQGGRGLLQRGAGVACIGLAFLSWEPSTGGNPASAASLGGAVAALNEPFVGLGAAAVLANLLRGPRDLRPMLVGVAGALPLLRLAFFDGGSHPAFELAIPFCLNVGVALSPALERLPAALAAPATAMAIAVFVGQYAVTGAFHPLFLERPSVAQRDAISWTRAHLPATSVISADAWAMPPLQDAAPDGPAFTGLMRAGLDPSAVEYRLQSADSRLITTGSDAVVRRWTAAGTEVALLKTGRRGATEAALLGGGSQYIARRFERGGAVTALDGTVMAQSQAGAMLRAVWSDDRAAFLRVWQWTEEHLTTTDGLLASTWRSGSVLSANTSADADADAALALLLAGRRWNDERLLLAGRNMVQGIWQREVTVVNGRPYPLAGDWAAAERVVAMAPGAFAPYAYDVFAEIDPDHDWRGLIASGYGVLSGLATGGAVPDWIALDSVIGELLPLGESGFGGPTMGDARAAVGWRTGLHLRWTGDPRAEAFLRSAATSRPTNRVADLASLLIVDPPAADRLFAEQIVGGSTRLGTGVYWGDLNDLPAQEAAWQAIALYADLLLNLWQSSAGVPLEQAS